MAGWFVAGILFAVTVASFAFNRRERLAHYRQQLAICDLAVLTLVCPATRIDLEDRLRQRLRATIAHDIIRTSPPEEHGSLLASSGSTWFHSAAKGLFLSARREDAIEMLTTM